MPRREWAFVALGSNIGDRARHLTVARAALAELPDTELVAASSIDETAPIGPAGQKPYLNQMVLLRTALPPRTLLTRCQAIERAAGRVRDQRWGPRTLDLDIVRFGEHRVTEPELSIPHPELPHRAFWQRELAELQPHVR